MSKDLVRKLSALAQDGRLAVFRTLVRAGPDGLPAGEVARALDVVPTTLSSQLAVLANAGLVRADRDGRSIIYSVNFDAISDLITQLVEDCCDGRPEICTPVRHAITEATSGASRPARQT